MAGSSCAQGKGTNQTFTSADARPPRVCLVYIFTRGEDSTIEPQAGLRACEEEIPGKSPSHATAQWLLDLRTLTYRCGGSAGITPASRFIRRFIAFASTHEVRGT